MKGMKLCLDLRFLQRAYENSANGGLGGVGTYCANLFRGLGRHRDIVISALVADRPLTPNFQRLLLSTPGSGLVKTVLFGRNSLFDRLSFGKYGPLLSLVESELFLSRRLSQSSVDVFHLLDHAAAPRAKCPIIITVHDLGAVVGKSPMTKFAAFVLKLNVRRASRVVFGSKATAEAVTRLMPEAAIKTRVCVYGLDLGHFEPGPSEPGRLTSRFGISSPYFLHVGVCSGRKNPDRIVEAVALLKLRTNTDFRFLFVGPYQVNPQAKEHLFHLGKRLGVEERLRVLGDVTVEELSLLYRNAQALVFPSLLEGFGYPVVEALACGRPCIVSNEGAVSEVVQDVGIKVDVRRADDIAAAMLSVLEGSQKDVSKSGPMLATRFGIDAMVNDYLQVYREAINTP